MSGPVSTEGHAELFGRLYRDRVLAHAVLFGHRHPNSDPPFHAEMIADWHNRLIPNLAQIAFRGSSKSTRAEEAIILRASFREFHNCIIFGASFDLAAQRLHAIRREFEKNEKLHQVFGDQRGQPWSDEKIELAHGVVIQAMGRGQALRGTKEEVKRPDLIFLDDVEDKQSMSTPEGRDKIQGWVMSEVLPAADPSAIVRIAANDMGIDCLANKLKDEGSGFRVKVYPWEYLDADGVRRATWPSRFPLEYIDETKKRFYALGRASDYNQEFMCRSEAPELKPFKQEMFRVEPLVRTWHNVQAMFDPARTARATSATTGYAAWSWIGGRLIVWEAWGRLLMPDEIVSEIFACNERLSPALIGVEEDGLNEFLMQPIRHEQVKRGVTLPVSAMRAPRGKFDFIRGLQPFFNAREVIFTGALPDLQSQLLSFPAGKIDCPNALAYALKMRPGAPVYEDFTARHVMEGLDATPSKQAWLCLNGRRGLMTAVLAQAIEGGVRVIADWVREGEPGQILSDIVKEANLEAQRTVRLVAGPLHFDQYNNVGICQAAAKLPMPVWRGVGPEKGRLEIRPLLRREMRGMPALLVSDAARWTLNGFAGGYARALLKGGVLGEHAEEGVYRILMEGLESFAGLLQTGSEDDDRDNIRYAYTSDGRRYVSALPQAR